MKRGLLAASLAAVFVIFTCCGLHAQGPYTLKTFYLIKGQAVQKDKVPPNAVRNLKSYPLKVREYTFPAPGMDYSPALFKAAGDAILALMQPGDRDNAAAIALAVADFTLNSIQARGEEAVISDNPHAAHKTALAVLTDGAGTNLEKCRLACALLRYFTVPARISSWKDRYVVEYYLKPASGTKIEPAWHVMDLTGRYDTEGEKTEPVAWHSIKAGELLEVQWEDVQMAVKKMQVNNYYIDGNEAEVRAAYDGLCEGKAPDFAVNTSSASFYLVKETAYEITFGQGVTRAAVELVMPFNESKPFKTIKFFAVSASQGMKVSFKRSHTSINPPNSGLVYTLPVAFEIAGEENAAK
ncbi:MAG: hypothetical protein LLG37_02295 [Spirochaetia bacterium]|nr:hypothetical protein [Spirochaetia bacterium]